ncbi:MAG: hypothetical protein IPI67_01295 [Myxococcales bacterium]|nr:hypothetical protein [Myxococcales bacterium]
MRRAFGFLLGSVVVSLYVAACSGASGGGGNGGSGNGSGAGGAGGISAGGSGGINLDGGGGTGALTGCAKETFGGELVPVDMFLMFDRSGSMKDSGKWGAVTSAVNQFVALPGLDKLGMGLGLFPTPASGPIPGACASDLDCGFYGPCLPVFNACNGSLAGNDSCVSTDYQKPTVGIEPFPGVGPKITAALAAAKPEGASTPAAPALEGAIDYATIWAQQHTDRVTVVILATDGEPNNCTPNSVQDVADHAQEGLTQTPSIKTFVVGVGDLTVLNQVAAAGGTDKAIIVSAGNAAKEFLDALNKIRGAVGCQYLIPVGGKADPNKVNVLFTPDAGGSGLLIKQVQDAASCLGQIGWYYDNPASPTQILLCPGACDLVSNGKGKVEIVLGCKTEVN